VTARLPRGPRLPTGPHIPRSGLACAAAATLAALDFLDRD